MTYNDNVFGFDNSKWSGWLIIQNRELDTLVEKTMEKSASLMMVVISLVMLAPFLVMV